MNNVQTDNDEKYFGCKLKLRIDNLPETPKVLDCYSGDNVLWKSIKKTLNIEIPILRIDAKEDKKGVYLKGDNIKFLKSMNLTNFNVIDLDAYGVPFHQLEIVLNSNFKGVVFVTFIQSLYGSLPSGLLNKIGYSKSMIKKCPTLFYKNGIDKFSQYLSTYNIKLIKGYFLGKKNYFYFVKE